MTDTKEKIMQSAAHLFSERGYDKVTMREIAKAVGIHSATIYHHFLSKGDILSSLYAFYASHRSREGSNLDELLQLVETHPPHEVLRRSTFHFHEDVREMLDAILVTAARRICAEPESEQFIRENIFASIENTLRPLLERMVELEKIEPLDIDAFLKIVSYFCFSAAALSHSSFRQTPDAYYASIAQIFSLVVSKQYESDCGS